jgi:tRNA modification GTPase
VGIAGVPNAGKSSLFNALLRQERSLVSSQHKTTRDVLAHRFGLPHGDCVLFDCAGLLQDPDHILDHLAQQAAIESLKHCRLALFCVDVTKSDWTEDLAVFALIPGCPVTVVPTKIDLLTPEVLAEKLTATKAVFETPIQPVSSLTRHHMDDLAAMMDRALFKSPATHQGQDIALLTTRHKRTLMQAIESLKEAVALLTDQMDEVVCMTLRATYQSLGHVEQHVDEQVLDTIFSRFCIGK